QLFRIRLHVMNVTDDATVAQLVTAHIEHGVVDVCQYHVAFVTHDAREFCGQVTRTTAQIQNTLPRTRAGTINRETLPQTMNPARHQIVHDVVFRRNRVEYFRYLGYFFFFTYGLK